MSWWTDTHIKYYPFLFSQYITHPDCPEKYLIFPCHKIHRAGGRGRNEEFSLWPEISQNSVKKKKKKITMQTVTVCPTTLSCTFWQPELCMCNQLGTPRWIILCTAQITYRRPGHGYCKKVASYLMLKNKTLFIETLRSLFLAAVNQGQLTGRKFQYFSFH